MDRNIVLTSASGGGATKEWLRALEMTALVAQNSERIFPVVIEEIAERFGEAPALLSREENLTYAQLAQRSNQYARWALEQGVAKGDVIALMMPNRPEYFAIWLGITRVGGIVALLNTSLTGRALAHCINIVAPKHVLISNDFADAYNSTLSMLTCTPEIWCHGPSNEQFRRIDIDVERFSGETIPQSARPRLVTNDRALYIYTSGTTGLPKAAIVDHYRLMMWTHWFAGMMNTQPTDRMYNALPMYHSVGGAVATGAVLVTGGSVVIQRKFSVSQFWTDIVEWDCTVFQYIGELCRYLVNSPHDPNERAHRLRLCCGNGLRADIWKPFQDRFRIPRILEFYAATEGSISLYNVEGVPGSIGRVPAFLAHRFPLKLIRHDNETQQPIRGENGFCIACKANEPGEAIGRIGAGPRSPGGRFEGYIDKQDTEKKILRDVFEKGDAWFRTGDLMRKDAKGYFYFVDRIGDTFRWKGENVSTTEVSEAIMDYSGISEANVYGVTVPANEGRAGMATIVLSEPIDMEGLRAHLMSRLPAYARPLFVRISDEMEVTTTFKQTKKRLVDEGYDPAMTTDTIYFDDPDRGTFVALDKVLFERIQSGQIRL
jgi:fatty-acyl-CoA synthase